MDIDRKQFYRDKVEQATNNIKTIKTSRTTSISKRGTYQGYRYTGDSKSNLKYSFKSKFFMQSLISASILGCFYMLIRNNSQLSKDILAKTKEILNTSISIESFEKLKENFSLQPNIVRGDENKVYIDQEQLDLMQQDLEQNSKN